MTSPKRRYEEPVVRAEEFRLGVYGDYGDLDTAPFLPLTTTDPRRKLPMD